MPPHIGIAACSAEGAALCYRTICQLGADRMGPHAHPQISMHTPSLADYVTALEAGDLDAVAALMLQSAGRLAAAGADFVICPDNTIHQALDRVRPASPLPWLSIAEVVARAATAAGHRRIAILGTRWLAESRVYPDAFDAAGLMWTNGTPADRALIDRIIMDELVPGRQKPASTAALHAILDRHRADGCDAAALVCTELPLVVTAESAPLPVLDSTRLLADAALRHALDGMDGLARVDR